MLGFILISLMANAAKPIEIEIDQIVYRIDLDEMTAIVCDAQDEIKTAKILSEIEYQSQLYSVTSIGQSAFQNCVNLEFVTIPETILEIGEYAFYRCASLISIILPSSINTIKDSTFMWSGLKSIIIPESVRLIEKEAFYHCSEMEKVIFNGSIEEIQEGAFCTYGMYNDTGNIKEVYVPSLYDWMNINFGSNNANPLSRNNAYLYIDNRLIEELIIPDGVEEISDRTFEGCGSIKSIKFSNTLKIIRNSAFYNCPNLISINLGKGIKEIDTRSFSMCPSLEAVFIHAENPPILNTSINWEGELVNAFFNSYPEYMTLHIPKGTKNLYENSYGWKDFGTIIDDLPNDSGVDEVSIDESKPIEIFNLNGVLVFSGSGDYKLPSGIYIIRQDWKSKKIVIK